MTLAEAQREVRAVFLGGSLGQLVTGMIWLLSAALGSWVNPRWGVLALFFGGMLIFPLTQGGLRLLGRPGSLRRENPLNGFSLQSVFAMGALYPLIYMAVSYNLNWFYPAFMLVVGAHYVSFIFLYGMWQYGALAAVLVGGGVALAIGLPDAFSAGGWLTGGVLVLFAAILWFDRSWKIG